MKNEKIIERLKSKKKETIYYLENQLRVLNSFAKKFQENEKEIHWAMEQINELDNRIKRLNDKMRKNENKTNKD